MFGNWVIAPLIVILLLSCPITSQTQNQTTNQTGNNTNLNIVQNTTHNKSNNNTLENIQSICLSGLREIAVKNGYPSGSVFYCDCSGVNDQFQCSAVFIDKEVPVTIDCGQNNRCLVKSKFG